MILLSGSNAPTVIVPAAYNAGGYVSISAGSCPTGAPVVPLNVPVQLEDGFGNAMAAGTSLEVAAESPLVGAAVSPGAVPNLVLGLDPTRDSTNAPKTTTNLGDPTLIVADEPTGDLDRATGEEVLSLLEQLVAELGKTIVMVTHDPKAAARAQRLVHLEKGVLVDELAA